MKRVVGSVGGAAGACVALVLAALTLIGCQQAGTDETGSGEGFDGADGLSVEHGEPEEDPLPGTGSPGDGPVTGSGEITSRQVDVSGVTMLRVGAHFTVQVVVGEDEHATIQMDDNLVELVDYTVTGDELHLGLKPGASVRNATLSAEITVRELSEVAASGASQVTAGSPLTGEALELTTSGTSQITGAVNVERLTATGSGASLMVLSGQVGELDLSGAGTSGLNLLDLAVRALDAELSGASCAVVDVSGTLAARTSGVSTLRYSGSPRITRQETSGVSTVGPNVPLGDRCSPSRS